MHRPIHRLNKQISSPSLKPKRSIFILVIGLVALATLACNLPGIVSRATPGSTQATALSGTQPDVLSQAMTIDEAFSTPLEDHRLQVLQQMGPPDSFRITFEEVDGKPLRQDEWSYFNDKTRFDFINGNLLWTINIQPMPDMAMTAITYDPMSFKDDMTEEEVRALLSDQQLVKVDASNYGVPGGEILAGNQILLGFDQGKLVYVETFSLAQRGG